MRVVLTTTSKPRADMIEALLTSASVPASVVARANGLNGAYTSYDVMLMRSADEPVARALIERTLASWQAHAEEEVAFDPPDLTTLDPRLAPDCPACAQTLPMDASLSQCPACAHEVDVAAMLVLLHGPELLESEGPQHTQIDPSFAPHLSPRLSPHPPAHLLPHPASVPHAGPGSSQNTDHPRDEGSQASPIAGVCPACGGALERARGSLFGAGGAARCLACRRKF